MFPAVPLPEGSDVRIPVDATLKPGWRYDSKGRVFVSDEGRRFRPGAELPKQSKIVYKVPSLARADVRKLSSPERDLQRYLQVILPPGQVASEHVEAVRHWPCIAEAQVGPQVSLP